MAKKRRLITRRRTKRIGLVACAIIIVLGVGSIWRVPFCEITFGHYKAVLNVASGRINGTVFYSQDQPFPQGGIRFDYLKNPKPSMDLTYRWFVYPTPKPVGRLLSPKLIFSLPLWFPLLLIAAPTAWLWRTDRRAKPWQCAKCRYDLRGLESEGNGVCPECGEANGGCR